MTKKYKVHELAKDFDIPSKYVIENLSKQFEGEKKSQTALEEKELDYIFDLITKNHSVESFDDYFNAVPKEKPKSEPKKEKAPSKEKETKAKSPAADSKKNVAKSEPAKQNTAIAATRAIDKNFFIFFLLENNLMMSGTRGNRTA